jgi:hypothetical protein
VIKNGLFALLVAVTWFLNLHFIAFAGAVFVILCKLDSLKPPDQTGRIDLFERFK